MMSRIQWTPQRIPQAYDRVTEELWWKWVFENQGSGAEGGA